MYLILKIWSPLTVTLQNYSNYEHQSITHGVSLPFLFQRLFDYCVIFFLLILLVLVLSCLNWLTAKRVAINRGVTQGSLWICRCLFSFTAFCQWSNFQLQFDARLVNNRTHRISVNYSSSRSIYLIWYYRASKIEVFMWFNFRL